MTINFINYLNHKILSFYLVIMQKTANDKIFNSLNVVNNLSIPSIGFLSSIGDNFSFTSKILLETSSNIFYGHNGITWVPLGGEGAETLQQTLAAGNTTNGENIIVTNGDSIFLQGVLSVNDNGAITTPSNRPSSTSFNNGYIKVTGFSGTPTGMPSGIGHLAIDELTTTLYIHDGTGNWIPVSSSAAIPIQNDGSGARVYKNSTLNPYQLRTLTPTNTNIVIVEDTDEILFDLDVSGLALDIFNSINITDLSGSSFILDLTDILINQFGDTDLSGTTFITNITNEVISNIDLSGSEFITNITNEIISNIDLSGSEFITNITNEVISNIDLQNDGAGAEVYVDSTSNPFLFRSLLSTFPDLLITQTPSDIQFDIDLSGLSINIFNSIDFADISGSSFITNITQEILNEINIIDLSGSEFITNIINEVLDDIQIVNIGSGAPIFFDTPGLPFQLRSLSSLYPNLSITNGGTEINFDLDLSGLATDVFNSINVIDLSGSTFITNITNEVTNEILEQINIQNDGSGAQVYINGTNDPFLLRSLSSNSNGLIITQSSNQIDFDLDISGITSDVVDTIRIGNIGVVIGPSANVYDETGSSPSLDYGFRKLYGGSLINVLQEFATIRIEADIPAIETLINNTVQLENVGTGTPVFKEFSTNPFQFRTFISSDGSINIGSVTLDDIDLISNISVGSAGTGIDLLAPVARPNYVLKSITAATGSPITITDSSNLITFDIDLSGILSTPTLQQVTNAGNSTTQNIVIQGTSDLLLEEGGIRQSSISATEFLIESVNAPIRIYTDAQSGTDGIFLQTRTNTTLGISLNTGNTITNTSSGDIDIITGESAGPVSGEIRIYTGNNTSSNVSANSGPIQIQTGNTDQAATGNIDIITGTSNQNRTGSIQLNTGDSRDDNTGFINLITGDIDENHDSGNITIQTGGSSDDLTTSGFIELSSGEASESGVISLHSGNANSNGSGSSGNVSVYSGNKLFSSLFGSTGEISIYSGNTQNGNSGRMRLYTGDTGVGNTGAIELYTGRSDSSGNSGDIDFFTGSSTLNTGEINMRTGTSDTQDSGRVVIQTGGSSNVFTGEVRIQTGTINSSVSGAQSGSILFATGDNGDTGNTGNFIVSTGVPDSGDSGNIEFTTGNASADSGDFQVTIGEALGSGSQGGQILFDFENATQRNEFKIRGYVDSVNRGNLFRAVCKDALTGGNEPFVEINNVLRFANQNGVNENRPSSTPALIRNMRIFDTDSSGGLISDPNLLLNSIFESAPVSPDDLNITVNASDIVNAIPNCSPGDTFECLFVNRSPSSLQVIASGTAVNVIGNSTVDAGRTVKLIIYIEATGIPNVRIYIVS